MHRTRAGNSCMRLERPLDSLRNAALIQDWSGFRKCAGSLPATRGERGPKEHCPMMRAALQWKRRRVNGEGIVAPKPFRRILERNRGALFPRVEPPDKMGLLVPIDMDFEIHGRQQWMRW